MGRETGRAVKSGQTVQAHAAPAPEACGMNTLTEAQRERVLALLRDGKTLRRIESETGHRRETIAAYGRRAGLIAGGAADLDAARDPASLCKPFHDAIATALEDGTSLRAVHDDLVRRFGFAGSYSTLKRYARTQIAPSRSTAMLLAA